MEIWDSDLPDTPEVHGDGGSAPSRAAQLGARDDFNAASDARADANIEAYQANPLCVSCEKPIAEGDVMRATLVYPLARLAHEGECTDALIRGDYRFVYGYYRGHSKMRGLRIGRAT